MFEAMFSVAAFILGVILGRWSQGIIAPSYKLTIRETTANGTKTIHTSPSGAEQVRCGDVLLVVKDKRVYANGKPWGPLPEDVTEAPEVPLTTETVLATDATVLGTVYGDLIVRGVVPVNVTIQGDVSYVDVATGNVTCGDVLMGVDAGGDVTCGDVSLGVDAGGDIHCGGVGLGVDAGGSVSCGNVGLNVDAGGSVNCGHVSGNIDAGGVVTVNQ